MSEGELLRRPQPTSICIAKDKSDEISNPSVVREIVSVPRKYSLKVVARPPRCSSTLILIWSEKLSSDDSNNCFEVQKLVSD
ncbi:hypothetical protein WA026_006265 [Henosepilachna vigintioctopunctata]|uniref:Uncharacterized protein n=1 Tax=Henosepilachna vigintioctopunctata TaxID=420089 RepID=A0AAW1TI42_9CUCU